MPPPMTVSITIVVQHFAWPNHLVGFLFQLCLIMFIARALTSEAKNTLICAFVLSRLDYCHR